MEQYLYNIVVNIRFNYDDLLGIIVIVLIEI